MTPKRMLIDASHPEETRVAIVAGNHLEDFDVEVQSRRQLKGNIYLAKVTRVEPSLQAAFVDYGGNRHGFLAFNEIHPDYYQIPVADREALIAEQKVAPPAEHDPNQPREETAGAEPAAVETLGGDIFEEVATRRPMALRRRYKIQEVIKRRQILLVQVVKEERGTKGAALTTYLSLAGRYCVLMPNTARGGGISRKINSGGDRKRLKSILSDFGIPEGMAVIVRTAGEKRSKAEIKRDYEYLMRLWSTVREVTLESMAPCLVHEEGDLIKRSIRDLYTKDIQEIVIDGDEAYRAAKDFMKLLIPSHTKRVQPFEEVDKHLFQFYGIEHQLDSMHSPEVQLRSGGYIVISPTEALVAIDVNSGRATRGRNIEETALKTNIEAAEEIALQLKLRDLAGLIVIDFIDMEDHRNQIKVERRLKDVMRSDRARIQIGRISPFGLLELSRQRMRPSLIETSSEPCPYCEGTGIRRSKESAALHLLRAIEDEGMQHRSRQVTTYIPTPVALYILNNKRSALARIEEKFKMSVRLESDDTLIPPNFRIDRIGEDGRPIVAAETGSAPREGAREDGGRRRRRGRRRHGEEGGDIHHEAPEAAAASAAADAGGPVGQVTPSDQAGHADVQAHPANVAPRPSDDMSAPRGKRRRRGRRGGRRRRREGEHRSGEAFPRP
ncbi:MAG: ribonuclease E/G, partial [Rhodospirillales bacterium]|nr:ribonuclease E/G [Rhodospirillales bacterium]